MLSRQVLQKKLATIIVDVPIVLDIELCDSKLFDKEVLEQKFELNGFNSLVKRISLSLKNGYVKENDITEKSTSEVKKKNNLAYYNLQEIRIEYLL